jgi:UDPglucose 6-dehydrogenase
MDIAIVGAGYVGLVAGACFAETGNDVICVDVDPRKVEMLRRGEIPIYEPGLSEMVRANAEEGRLTFTTSLQEGVQRAEVIFIAVGTPQDEDGSADLTHVLAVAKGIGMHMNGPKVIVDKSTVPVGTAEKVRAAIAANTQHKFEVVSNPEFLKEGAAIDDFMKPDRVVIGVSSEEAARVMRELYAPFVRTNNPILIMDIASAEMTKYASNAMLATRVSFMNELALLCERAGADVDLVRIGVGTDSRIGMPFLFPGIGYGGSCFPKDVQALIRTGADFGVELQIAKAVESANARQKSVLVDKIKKFYGKELKGKKLAVWGLAFKPRTDDTREAPALVVVEQLAQAGAQLQLYDPEANETFRERCSTREGISYFGSAYDAAQGVDALVVCTEWNEFRRPNMKRLKECMRQPVIFDGRNIFDPKRMATQGFAYLCIGRPDVGVR